jgi:nicotinamidase-related amidase
MAQAPRRALIVIDAQNEYFSGKLRIEYPDPQKSLANIGRAMDAAAQAGVPIVVVQQFAPPGAPIFARDSVYYELHESVARRKRDYLIEKKLPSAYAGTDLADWLAKNAVDTLSVAGYMTHNCVASTVIHALHAGLAVEVLSDATGSLPYANRAGRASAEETHRVFSVVFQSRFAAVMETDAWIAALQGGPVHRDNIFASHQEAIKQAR